MYHLLEVQHNVQKSNTNCTETLVTVDNSLSMNQYSPIAMQGLHVYWYISGFRLRWKYSVKEGWL